MSENTTNIIIALIGLVGVIVTAIIAPIISKKTKKVNDKKYMFSKHSFFQFMELSIDKLRLLPVINPVKKEMLEFLGGLVYRSFRDELMATCLYVDTKKENISTVITYQYQIDLFKKAMDRYEKDFRESQVMENKDSQLVLDVFYKWNQPHIDFVMTAIKEFCTSSISEPDDILEGILISYMLMFKLTNDDLIRTSHSINGQLKDKCFRGKLIGS